MFKYILFITLCLLVFCTRHALPQQTNGLQCGQSPILQPWSDPCYNLQSFSLLFQNSISFLNQTWNPLPVALSTHDGDLIVSLKYNTTYTLTYSVNGLYCPFSTSIISKSGPSVVVDQPKCRYSSYSIMSSGFENGTTFQIDANSIQQFPVLLNPGKHNLTYSQPTEESSCLFPIVSSPQSDTIPLYTVMDSACYKSNGTIQLFNATKYSSIKLLDNQQVEVKTSQSGSFNSIVFFSLKGSYILKLNSKDCGEEIVPIVVGDLIPKIAVNIIKTECQKVTLLAEIMDPEFKDPEYEFRLDGELFDSNNQIATTFKPTYSILFSSATCLAETDIGFDYPVMNIDYRIQYPDQCSENVVVLLNLHNVNYTNFKIVNENNQSISMDKNNSISIPIGSIASISADCYNEPFIVPTKSFVDPSYQVMGHQLGYCFEFVNITVYNYLSFKEIYLESVYNKTRIDHTNGLFKFVSRQEYNIIYTYQDCKGKKNIQLVDNNLPDPKYQVVVSKQPDCVTNQGTAMFSVISPLTGQKYGPFIQSFIVADKLNLSFTTGPTCKSHFVWDNHEIFTYDSKVPDDIKITKKPSCKYSNDGVIDIYTNSNISFILLDGKMIKGSGSTFSNIPYGVHDLIIQYGTNECGTYETKLNVTATNMNFNIDLDTSSVTDCTKKNGKINLKNPLDFSSFTIDSTDVNNTESRYYKLDFVSKDQTCKGSWEFFVGSTPTVEIISSIVQPPSCFNLNYHSDSLLGDGVLKINGYKSNSSVVFGSIKELNTPVQYPYPNTMIGVSPGSKKILMVSGTCSWTKQLDIETHNDNIDYYPIDKFNCIDSDERGEIKSSNPFIKINSVEYNGVTLTTPPFIIKINSNTNVLVKWNDNCQKNIHVRPNIGISTMVPTFVQEIENCLAEHKGKIKVAEYLDYDLSIPFLSNVDTNGELFNIMDKNTILAYRNNKNGCRGEINVNLDYKRINPDYHTVQVVNESCSGSLDGTLYVEYSSFNDFYYQLRDVEKQPQSYPCVLFDGNPLFSTIGTTQLTLTKFSRVNPYCQKSMVYHFQGTEPTIQIQSQNMCPFNGQGSMVSGLNSHFQNTTYYLINPKDSTQNQTKSTGTFKNLIPGDYNLIIDINDVRCKREIVQNKITIPSIEQELIIIENTNCEAITIRAFNMKPYSLEVYNFDQSINIIQNVSGNYTLTIAEGSFHVRVARDNDTTSNCVIETDVEIVKCPNDKSKKTRLIIGLVVGIVVGSALIAATVYFIIKKRKALATTKPVQNPPLQKNTVSIFTGGKIQQLDDF
ncbi:hypothetical protein CYY_003065 [Polysphondylium violaceum]|uniref:Transmembrane protein n=1 Tax=Polysphondylium violaceum TaxID=133409 RepID=A0A8J4Q0A8_9MYCE|nr:hypothetical protein CYY_003065 [Polysphondylium violaceum]